MTDDKAVARAKEIATSRDWYDEMQARAAIMISSARILAEAYDEQATKIERLKAIIDPINLLRADEASWVSLICSNPDFDGPSEAIEVCGDWTAWKLLRFTGDTVAEALDAAVLAMNERRKRL